MKYPAYPNIKPSGIEWLGDIPAHWAVTRLSYITYCLDGRRIPLNGEQRSSRQGDIPYWGANGILDHIDGWLFDESLVLLGEDGAPFFDPYKPVAFFVTEKIWVNNHAHVLRPRSETNPRFLAYVLNSVHYGAFIAGSTRDKLTQSDMNAIPIQLPVLPEQRAIADFLDTETAKLDTLVAKKRELIERLKEKRTALISRTVTRGLPPEPARDASLNPHPKLKPSGIEWLGEIPEHWEVKRVKHLGNIRYGLGEPPEYTDEGLAFIRATDIQRGKIDLDSVCKVSPHDVPWSRRPQLAEGEILVVRSGAYTGDSAIVPQEVAGSIAGYDMVLTVTKGVPHFVAWVLLSKYMLESQIHLSRLRAAQPHLNAEELGGFVIVIPQIAEQRAIADYLDRETSKIDRMVTKVEAAIERLQEYRTALITAAVTGKIDVRTKL